jgi:PDZ domain
MAQSQVLLVLAASLLLPALARPQSAAPSTLGITAPNGAVPIRIENDLLYLGGSLQGAPELAFVVDTGATRTSLDPNVARAAGYNAGSSAALRVARRIFPEQRFALASTEYITATSGQPTAGVLGQPLLTRYSLAVDFDRMQASLLSPEICPASAVRLQVFTAGGLPFVEGTIPLLDGSRATGLFLVDTGQPGAGIVLASSFLAAHPGLSTGPKLEQSATGNTPATTLIRLKALELGPFALKSPIAELGPTEASTGNPRLAGVLGLEVLSRFNFVLNERYASLYLEPNRRVHQPFEADMSGMQLRAGPDRRLTVAAVTPNSPAAEMHVQAGDILLRVEDRPVNAANLGSVTTALRSTPDALVHLELERNGQPVRITLRLRPML